MPYLPSDDLEEEAEELAGPWQTVWQRQSPEFVQRNEIITDIGSSPLRSSPSLPEHLSDLVPFNLPRGIHSSGSAARVPETRRKSKIKHIGVQPHRKNLPLPAPSYIHKRRKKGNTQRRFTETRRKRKFKPGTRSLQEIRQLQKSTNLCTRFAPVSRLIREITQSLPRSKEFRWQKKAVEALQEAMEAYIIQIFTAAQRCALHAKRVSVMSKDIELLRSICKDLGISFFKE